MLFHPNLKKLFLLTLIFGAAFVPQKSNAAEDLEILTLALGVSTVALAVPYVVSGIKNLVNKIFWPDKMYFSWVEVEVKEVETTYGSFINAEYYYEDELRRIGKTHPDTAAITHRIPMAAPLHASLACVNYDINRLKSILIELIKRDIILNSCFGNSCFLVQKLFDLRGAIETCQSFYNEAIYLEKRELKQTELNLMKESNRIQSKRNEIITGSF